MRLITSVRHAPLREFSLWFSGNPDGCSVSVCGLERLSIVWNTDDSSSSLAHLYPLFRSSLTTLVELNISEPQLSRGLELLRPAATTLRHFTCELCGNDEGILSLIPEVFPGLTYLSIILRPESHSVLWKVFIVSPCIPNSLDDFFAGHTYQCAFEKYESHSPNALLRF
jgi:hypothetical protein